MATRRSASQIRAQLQRAQQKQRQAISNYNAAVRKQNRAIDRYNAAARTHNARIRANRERLRREVNRLNSRSSRTQTVRVSYRVSVEHFARAHEALVERAERQGWDDAAILDLASGEAANSVATVNALLEQGRSDATDQEVRELQGTLIGDELNELDEDLDRRWRGALFALHPQNPDAARHFCTSAREMLTDILSLIAPTERILEEEPDCERTPEGKITRRARITFCLRRTNQEYEGLADYVEEDIDNVVSLFGEFNSGTHGEAGTFSLEQLRALKARVEDAVRFVLRIAR